MGEDRRACRVSILRVGGEKKAVVLQPVLYHLLSTCWTFYSVPAQPRFRCKTRETREKLAEDDDPRSNHSALHLQCVADKTAVDAVRTEVQFRAG